MLANRTPRESQFGKALIDYLTSDANQHTSFLGANLTFTDNHPDTKLELKPYQGIAVVTLFFVQRRYVSRAFAYFSFGIAIYATDSMFARHLREELVEAIELWDASGLQMDNQQIESMVVKNQLGPMLDRTGLQVAEITVNVNLSSRS